MSETARLILDNQEIEIPVITGSENEKALDISKLRASTGYITLDPGFKNTGSTQSAITFLNGEKGILRYRGYAIEDLAEKASFLEVAYLLIYGELPKKEELDYFTDSITHHTLLHENMKRFFDAFPLGAHPMGMLSSMISSLSTFYPESQEQNRSFSDIERTIHRIIAKLPTLASQAYKHNKGLPTMYPNNDLSYEGNFLYMASGNIEYKTPMSSILQDTNGHISSFLNENSSNDTRSRGATVAMSFHLLFFLRDVRTAKIQLP